MRDVLLRNRKSYPEQLFHTANVAIVLALEHQAQIEVRSVLPLPRHPPSPLAFQHNKAHLCNAQLRIQPALDSLQLPVSTER